MNKSALIPDLIQQFRSRNYGAVLRYWNPASCAGSVVGTARFSRSPTNTFSQTRTVLHAGFICAGLPRLPHVNPVRTGATDLYAPITYRYTTNLGYSGSSLLHRQTADATDENHL